MKRIDKILSEMNIGTRSQIKQYLKKGMISLNGELISRPESKVDEKDVTIQFQGITMKYEPLRYFMMNKPQGCVSATEDKRETTVLDLLEESYTKGLFPVGRLDKDTEGLLILSNDGELAHLLLSPKKHVKKTYYAVLEQPLLEEERLLLEKGVSIGDEKDTLPAKIEYLGPKEITITITEGRFHQIKRMFSAVGNEVVFLKRIAFGPLQLDDTLQPGDYRNLSEEEISILKIGTTGKGL